MEYGFTEGKFSLSLSLELGILSLSLVERYIIDDVEYHTIILYHTLYARYHVSFPSRGSPLYVFVPVFADSPAGSSWNGKACGRNKTR
jgi:hypothetical protein